MIKIQFTSHGECVMSWDPDAYSQLSPEDRRRIAAHERGHLEASKSKLSPEEYTSALKELARFEAGTSARPSRWLEAQDRCINYILMEKK